MYEEHEVEAEERLVPQSWVLSGIAASILIGTVLVWLVFGADGIKPWATILGFGISVASSITIDISYIYFQVMGAILSVLGCVSSCSFRS